MTEHPDDISRGEILFYQTEDGQTRVECRFEHESLWLTQAAIADLFLTTPQNITLHLKAIYSEGELSEASTCKQYLQVQTEGGREVSRKRNFYNLDAILAGLPGAEPAGNTVPPLGHRAAERIPGQGLHHG